MRTRDTLFPTAHRTEIPPRQAPFPSKLRDRARRHRRTCSGYDCQSCDQQRGFRLQRRGFADIRSVYSKFQLQLLGPVQALDRKLLAKRYFVDCIRNERLNGARIGAGLVFELGVGTVLDLRIVATDNVRSIGALVGSAAFSNQITVADTVAPKGGAITGASTVAFGPMVTLSPQVISYPRLPRLE